MSKIRNITFVTLFSLVPLVTFADSHDGGDEVALGGIMGLFILIRSIINMIVPLLFALAVVFFLFGIFKYFFLHADEPDKREEGRKFMLWGIIALFVMVSFWGLVNILSSTFFGVRVPDVPNQGSSSYIESETIVDLGRA